MLTTVREERNTRRQLILRDLDEKYRRLPAEMLYYSTGEYSKIGDPVPDGYAFFAYHDQEFLIKIEQTAPGILASDAMRSLLQDFITHHKNRPLRISIAKNGAPIIVDSGASIPDYEVFHEEGVRIEAARGIVQTDTDKAWLKNLTDFHKKARIILSTVDGKPVDVNNPQLIRRPV